MGMFYFALEAKVAENLNVKNGSTHTHTQMTMKHRFTVQGGSRLGQHREENVNVDNR